MSKKVVLASGNPGKLRELQALLAGVDFDLHLQSEFNVPDVAETGLTFVENAIIKARHACEHTGLPALADDSGIEVDALNGQPGIYSARYADGRGDKANNAKLLDALKEVPDERRQGRFVCLMVYMRHAADPTPVIAQGVWEGSITRKPKGDGGFGYDPLFYVPDCGCTSAQLSAEEKNRRSHRAQALKKMVALLKPRA